jgi:phage-related tail protein
VAENSDRRDASLPQLVKELTDETSTLVRKEVELAKAEVTGKVGELRRVAQDAAPMASRNLEHAKGELATKGKAAATGAAQLAGAAAFGLVLLGVFAAAGIAALSLVFAVWAACLIVAGVLLLITLVLAVGGLGYLRSAMPPVPEQALTDVRRDIDSLKRRVQDAFPPKPEQTAETVKEDVEWLKTLRQSETR